MSEQMNVGDVSAAAADFQPEPGVGAQLRAAREANGLLIEEVAHALKLGPRQVDALESGDWQALPGNTFIRGFVRNYARLMQLDPVPLMTSLDSVLEKPLTLLVNDDARPATMPHGRGAHSGHDRTVMAVGALLVLLACLAYFLMPNDLSSMRDDVQRWIDSFSRQEESPAPPPAPVAEPVFPPGTTPQQVMNPQAEPPAPVQTPAPTPAPAPVPAEQTPQAALPATPSAPEPVAAAEASALPKGFVPVSFVFEKDSWLEVRDRSGKVIFSQRVPAGNERTLSGQGPLSLVVGYAPGVRVSLRGQAVDLTPHSRGDVARLVLE